MSLLFILWVVAARTVRACHEQLQFFAIHRVPGEAQLNSAYVDDASAIATELRRQLRGLGRGSCRGDNDRVHTVARKLLHQANHTWVGDRERKIRAHLPGLLNPSRV